MAKTAARTKLKQAEGEVTKLETELQRHLKKRRKIEEQYRVDQEELHAEELDLRKQIDAASDKLPSLRIAAQKEEQQEDASG
jgi:hypothetical protein